MKTDTTSPKWEKASLTAWPLMYSGRLIVTKIGSFPFLRGSIRVRKLSSISESPKRHWISVTWSFSFAVSDPKIKTSFEGETLYRAPISVIPSDSRMPEISYSRIFFWVSSEHIKWPSSDLSLIWAEWDSSRDLCQTPPARELFNTAEFGSKISSGVELHSSSERRKKLNILSFNGCLVVISLELVVCWFKCSVPVKWTSGLVELLLVTSSGCRFPTKCCFALFCGGESLELSIWFVTESMLDPCSMM